jgi:hypothetical protein
VIASQINKITLRWSKSGLKEGYLTRIPSLEALGGFLGLSTWRGRVCFFDWISSVFGTEVKECCTWTEAILDVTVDTKGEGGEVGAAKIRAPAFLEGSQ